MQDKLTEFIQGFRVCKKTKDGLTKLAGKDKRKLCEYVRICLDKIVDFNLYKKEEKE